MSSDVNDPHQELRALKEAYAAALPGKVDEIVTHWNSLRSAGEPDKALTTLLHRLSHSLTGSAGAYGYPAISEHSRSIEQILNACLKGDLSPDGDQVERVERLLARLGELATAPPESQSEEATGEIPKSVSGATEPLVYLIEDDQRLREELALQLGHFGYRMRVFPDTKNVEETVARQRPDAFIVDINLPEGPLAGIGLLQHIQRMHGPDLPVIFMSSQDDFETRLAAVHAGGEAYFPKPLELSNLIDRLDHLTRREVSEPYRVLIIDDDASLAEHNALVLRAAGMDVNTVNQPEKVLAALAYHNPELVLMDVYMPICSGLDLARLIRQQDAYLGIPIVFLSSETSEQEQFKAMRMGGDDFLTKPIKDRHLISSVAVRAERARLLNAQMVRDSLTGLLNHTKIKEQLEVEILRADRSGSAMTFCMIDIDHFKQVNDRYGHMTGDRVIKTLARVLKQRLRKTDGIGRYGGEEFAVILPDCDLECSVKLLDEIRAGFADLRYLHEGEEFSVTFSAGLASFPFFTDATELGLAADRALYDAKREGRNRIATAEPAPPVKEPES